MRISLQNLIPPKSLPWRDKWLFIKSVSLALFIRVSIRLAGFKRTVRLIRRLENKTHRIENEVTELKRFRAVMILAYRLYPVVNCLAICTACWLLLKQRGIRSDLKFGMRKEGNKLKAHAWLEHQGETIAQDNRFKEKYIAFSQSIL